MRCPSRAYLPVDGLEERVCFDVLDPVCPVPQPVLRVSLEEDSQEALSLRREKLGHAQLSPGRGGGGRRRRRVKGWEEGGGRSEGGAHLRIMVMVAFLFSP